MSHTGNPRHPNNPPSDPAQEPTGPVAKDSLASESIAAGGAFADNKNPEVLGVKGHQSTLATTDHTNAETLKPASSGAAREKAEGGSTQYPDAGATQGFEGTHSPEGYRGGPSNPGVSSTTTSTATENFGSDKPAPDPSKISSSGTSQATTSSSTGGTTGVRPHVDQAPNYTLDTSADSKPKGKNLVEGGDIPENVGTHTGAVTGPNDPGRLAEQNYTKMEAAGAGTQDYSATTKQGEGQYDALDNHERA